MKIGLVQLDSVWENKQANKRRIVELLDSCADKLDLILLPELTLTGFTMRSKKFAESCKGTTVEFYCRLAAAKAVHFFGGIIERNGGHYYNTLVHISRDGQLTGKYRKIHPFSFTGENRFYDSGGSEIITRVEELRVGLSICYDLRFPELFRRYAKAGAHVLINIANWPVQRMAHWRTLLQARAIENQCYVLAVNRVGKDKSNDYNGGSCVFSPIGEEVLCAGSEEGVFTAEISARAVTETRAKFPFLKDMRLL